MNTEAGVIHPGASSMTWAKVDAVTGVNDAQVAGKTRTAFFTGDTLAVVVATEGRNTFDDKTKVKLVDASVKNGCDSALAGHPDVRSTAYVLTSLVSNSGAGGVGSTCAGGTMSAGEVGSTAEGDGNKQYFRCKSAIGLGRKACQDLGCTYNPPSATTYTLTVASTNYVDSGADPKIVGTLVKQATSGAEGTLAVEITGAVTTVVVASTNSIPFDTTNAITVVGDSTVNVVPSGVAAQSVGKFSVGFAFADTMNFPASATTTTWRLCMVSKDALMLSVLGE